MRVFSYILFLLSIATTGYSQGTHLQKHWWLPNGPVNAIAVDSVNAKVYLGGYFNYVGREKLHGAVVNKSSATFNDLFPNFHGSLSDVVPDDSGGWYVAGRFSSHVDSSINYLVHYNKNGVLTKKLGDKEPDGFVHTIKKDGNTLYVGGDFSGFYPKDSVNPFGSALGVTSGALINSPIPNGAINISVSDGKGGYYLGGTFSKMGDSLRAGLAHVDSNWKVTAWNPSANNTVRAMFYDGNLLYVGGDFTIIGGQSRTYLAAINAISGAVTSWNPVLNNSVSTIVTNNTTIYIGGKFTSINGLTRNRLASFELANGNLTNWDPNANGEVKALAIYGSNIYVGGGFTEIDYTNFRFIASFSISTGSLRMWSSTFKSYSLPFALNPGVASILPYGGTILIGGEFAVSLNNQTIYHLAALDTTSGSPTNWAPNPNYRVTCLAKSGNTLYVGGAFSKIANRKINQCAALSLTTGQILWATNVRRGLVNTLTVGGNSIYLGGAFTQLGIMPKNGLVAFDVVTGNELNWFPDINSDVYIVNADSNNIYIGGEFSNVNGVARNYIAAFNKTTKSLLSFNPSPNRSVKMIEPHANNLYVGGGFDTINGIVRKNLAAINLSNYSITSWNPNIGLPMSTSHNNLAKFRGDTAYLSRYNVINNNQQNWAVSAVSLTNSNVSFWNVNFDNWYSGNALYDIAIDDNRLYVAGAFDSVNAQPRKGIVSLELATGALMPWEPNPNNLLGSFASITKIALGLDEVFVIGNFRSIGGKNRQNLVELDMNTGEPTDWNIGVNGTINTIDRDEMSIYIGGDFTSVGNQTRNNVAAINTLNKTVTPLSPNINGPVYALVVHDSTLYIGGSFTRANWMTRNNIAAVSKHTGSISSWNPNANATVFSMVKNSSSLYVGGSFGSIGGQSRNKLAALSHSTGLATSWNTTGGTVYSMAINGNVVYLGGDFHLNYAGQNWYYYGAKNATTGVDINLWNTGTSINGNTKAIAANSSNVYLGGTFTTIKGVERRGFAKLSLTNNVEPFIPIEGEINALALSGRSLFVGGSYVMIPTERSYYSNVFAVFSDSCATFKARATVAQSTTICLGDSLVISANPGTLLKYQWLTSNNVVIAGEQRGTFAARLNGNYRVVVSNTFCSDTSNTIVVATKPKPLANIIAQGATNLCTGGNVQLNANTRLGLTYQWLCNDTIINGQTSNNYIANTSGNYRAIIIDTNGCSEKSNLINVLVNAKPTITPQSNTTFCEGDTVRLLTNFNSGQLYQWQKNGVNILGQNSNTFIASEQGSYRVIVNYTSCGDTSLPVDVKVNPKPIRNIIALGDTVLCKGNYTELTTQSGVGLTYTWFKNDTILNGKTDTIYKLNSSGAYKIQVKDSNNCINQSNVITIKVNPKPLVNILAQSDTIFCEKDSVVLTASKNMQSYQWLKDKLPISGNVSSSYIAKSSGNYQIIVTDSNNCVDTTDKMEVKVSSKPISALTAIGKTNVCSGEYVQINAGLDSNASYQWFNQNSAITGNNSPSFITNLSGSYRVVLINRNNCTDTSNVVKVNVYPKPNAVITLQGPSTICEGSQVALDANKETGLVYQWLKNNTIISNETNSKLMVGDSGTYGVITTDSNTCKDTSNNIVIDVKTRGKIGALAGEEKVWKDSIYNYTILENTNDKYIWMVNGGQKLTNDSTNTIAIRCTRLNDVSVSASKLNTYGCISDTVSRALLVTEWVDSLDIDRDTLNVGPNSGIAQVNILSNRSFVLSTVDNWFSLSNSSGSGNMLLSLSVQQNHSPAPRTSLISVSGGNITKTILLIQSASVGLNDKEELNKIALYPSPSFGEFNIEIADGGQFSYVITDILGRVIRETTSLSDYAVNKVNINVLQGIYFVDVFKGSQHKVFKIIVLNN